MIRVPRQKRNSLRGQRGQTATEYLMVISVLVIALAYVSYGVFFNTSGPIAQGLNSMLNPSNSSDLNIPTQVNRGFVTTNP